MMEQYIQWVTHRPWRAMLLALLLLMAGVPGLSRLGLDQDYRVFFADEFPPLAALNELHATYNKNDNLLIVMDPPSGRVFDPQSLMLIRKLTEEAWQLPFAVRVESLTNYQQTQANGDDLVVADLVPGGVSLEPGVLDSIERSALKNPELVDRLVSRRGDVAGINVVIELPGNSNAEAGETMAKARELVERWKKHYPGLGLYLTGIIPMNHAFPEASMQDMTTLVPAMYGVIIVLLIVLLRSWWGTAGVLMVITFSVLTALGFSGLMGIRLTPPSASTPTMIMTLALADSVHLLTYMLRSRARGMGQREAVAESLRANFQPMVLTTAAAMVGFLSMNWSESPPFRDLGTITAMGVAAAFVYSTVFLPALMCVVPVRGTVPNDFLGDVAARIGDRVIAHRRGLGVMTLLVVAVMAMLVPRLELNDEWLTYFDRSLDFRVDTEFAADRLTGIYTIEYSVPAGEPGGIADPDYLAKLDEFVSWYRDQPHTRHVAAITDMVKRINRSMHGDDPSWYRLPDDRRSASDLLMVYEMSLPYGHDLTTMLDTARSATRMVVSLDVISTVEMKQLEQRAENWMKDHFPPQMRTHGSSPTLMFAHISQRNIHQMLTATAVALLLVSLVLVGVLRSLKLGLLSLVPNLVPAILGFGLWSLLVGEVGLATSIVAGMTLGIVVDDTVHFLAKYRRARREHGATPEEAVRFAFNTVGSAMLVTTVVLVAGFLVLSQSAFEMNSGMGLLTAIVLLFALLADFTLLPVLLLALDRQPGTRKAGEDEPVVPERILRQEEA